MLRPASSNRSKKWRSRGAMTPARLRKAILLGVRDGGAEPPEGERLVASAGERRSADTPLRRVARARPARRGWYKMPGDPPARRARLAPRRDDGPMRPHRARA